MNKVIVICMVFLFGVLAGVSTAGNLTDNGNGTVTDSGTHLMGDISGTFFLTVTSAHRLNPS